MEASVLDRVNKLLSMAESAAAQRVAGTVHNESLCFTPLTPVQGAPQKAQATPLTTIDSNAFTLASILSTETPHAASPLSTQGMTVKAMSPSPRASMSPAFPSVNLPTGLAQDVENALAGAPTLASRVVRNEEGCARSEAEAAMLRQALSVQEQTIAALQNDSEVRELAVARERDEHRTAVADLLRTSAGAEGRAAETHAAILATSAQLRTDLAHAESTLAEKDAQIRSLEKKLQTATTAASTALRNEGLDILRKENASLIAALDSLTANTHTAEAELRERDLHLAALESEVEGRGPRVEPVSAVHRFIVQAKEDVLALRSSLSVAERRIVELTALDGQRGGALQDAERDVAGHVEAEACLQQKILQLEMEKNEIGGRSVREMNANAALVAELKGQVAGLCERLHTATLQNHDPVPKMHSPRAALGRAENRIAVLSGEKVLMSEEIQRLKQYIAHQPSAQLSGDMALQLAEAVAQRNRCEEELVASGREIRLLREQQDRSRAHPMPLSARQDLATEISSIQDTARREELRTILSENAALRLSTTEAKVAYTAASEAAAALRAEKCTIADELAATHRLYSIAQEELAGMKRLERAPAPLPPPLPLPLPAPTPTHTPPQDSFDREKAGREMEALRSTLTALTQVVREQEVTYEQKLAEAARTSALAVQEGGAGAAALSEATHRIAALEGEVAELRAKEASLVAYLQKGEVEHSEIIARLTQERSQCEVLLREKEGEVEGLKCIARNVAGEAAESKLLVLSSLSNESLIIDGVKHKAQQAVSETARNFEHQLADALTRLNNANRALEATEAELTASNQRIAQLV